MPTRLGHGVCSAWPLVSLTLWSGKPTGPAPVLRFSRACTAGLQVCRPLFRPGLHQAKGLVSCVYAPVSAQTSPLGKGASTTRVCADVDHLSGVNPLVCSQVAGVAEGALAVGVRAGKGALSGMNPYVRLQIPGLGKGASTARVRAGKGALSGMNPLVRLQIAELAKGASTALVRADQGPVSCMASCV